MCRVVPWDLFLWTLRFSNLQISNLVYPPTFCIIIVFNLSWVLQSFQEEAKTMFVQKSSK